jgi:hypothetical protein
MAPTTRHQRITRASQTVLGLAMLVVLFRQDAEPFLAAAPMSAPSVEDISSLRCSSRNLAGVGLQGDYFMNVGARGPLLLTRVDPSVEFDASLDWPSSMSRRPRSARWHGWVKVPLTGPYRFHAEPSVSVTVSGLALAGATASDLATIELTAGRFYPIVVEADLQTGSGVKLEWTPPHGVRFVIPKTLLFLPTPTATAGT